MALDWSTTDGSATADDDYTAVSGGTVNFVSGESLTQTISVTTLQDTLAESNESFTVTLAAPGSGLPTGVSLDTATATGTIEDDDPIVASVAADAGSVTEGGPAEFTVTLAGGTSTADGGSHLHVGRHGDGGHRLHRARHAHADPRRRREDRDDFDPDPGPTVCSTPARR